MRGTLLLASALCACGAPKAGELGSGGAPAGVAGHSAGGLTGGGAGSGSGGAPSASGGVGSGSGGLSSVGGTAGAAVGGAAGTGATGGLAGTSGAGGMAVGGRADGGAGGLGAAGTPGVGGQGASAGAGGSGGSGVLGDDRCSVAVHDPATPPTMLSLTGSLGTHDPALLEVDGTFYLYATGRGLGAKTSTNLMSWQGASAVFSSNPGWVADEVPGASDLWAPDISYFGGQYHLYYSASTFGKNRSCIGHATRAALDSGSFTDHGSVFCSNVTTSGDDFNAIDPHVILDLEGTPWLTFGSFWGGIKQFKLTTEGTRADDELLSIADRPPNGSLEGAFIVRRCGYYYLFVSWGACCDGAYDYNMRVGRGTSVNGPFTDQEGKTMMSGGGTLLVEGNSTWTAPGHNAVIFVGDRAYNVYHALNSNHQSPTLRVAELVWDADGWPISAGP